MCQDVLVKSSNIDTMASETLTALKSHTGLMCLNVGGLNLPTPAFIEFVKLCYVTFSVRARSLVLSSDNSYNSNGHSHCTRTRGASRAPHLYWRGH